jgi:limonene-1,2-epoxide hydrolase
VRSLFAAVDGADVDTIAALMTDDVQFRFGNAPTVHGRAAVAEGAETFARSVAGVRHEIRHIWEIDGHNVVCVMDVHYERLDGRRLTLPCCNVFRLSGELIADYRIYMDVNPVLAP